MQRNGGKLLVECLTGLGLTKSFGVPGESYLAVLDALYDVKGKLDYTLCRHEGGAAFMAAAYGKLTGKPGICFVTRGPGATNAAIGVHTAMQDSSPMLLFIGQVGRDMREREAFQEINYRATFGTMAKWATEIDDVDRIPEIVSRAYLTSISGRPGPVVIALPEDMLTDISRKEPLSQTLIWQESAPDATGLGAAVDLLRHAERPLILYGGCNWQSNSMRKLEKFAVNSAIPVVAAFRYQDQFDNHCPAYVGDAGVGMAPAIRELIKQADVLLALNVRFGENVTDGYSLLQVPVPQQRLIHIHLSERELGKIYLPEIGLHCGHNAFVSALPEQALDERVKEVRSHWFEEAQAGYRSSFDVPAQPSPVDMGEVMAHLRQTLPQDAILTNGAGNFAVWSNKLFQFGPEQRLLAPQSGAMGYGVPAAIAAKIAYPERRVVCFAGDGDFQMTCAELGSAMQAGAQPIILILNNGTYGTIRAHQERNYPARVSGTDLQNPDFVGLARSYGFHAERVEKTADFAAAFARACQSPSGAVLDLAVSAEALTPRQTLSSMRATALKKLNQNT